jgi:hypothetical protein
MHDNPDMKYVHQDYSPMNDLLLNVLFELIVVVIVDQMTWVEEYHHQEYLPLDHLDQIQKMDC